MSNITPLRPPGEKPAPPPPAPLPLGVARGASTLETALALVRAGLGVFPLRPMFRLEDDEGGIRLACDCEKNARRAARRRGDPGAAAVKLEFCPRAGKHPRPKNGHLGASTAPDVVRPWFDTRTNIGLGVVCGPLQNAEVDLVVLDFDGAEGEATLAAIEAEHGPLGGLGVTTGRGGHRWFLAPSAWQIHSRNGHWPAARGPRPEATADRPPTGFDIKARGGFVAAPPSPHKSGRRYQWLCLDALDLDAEAPLVIPPAPEWLRAQLPTRAPSTGPAPLGALEAWGAEVDRRALWATAAVRAAISDLESTTSQRNPALRDAATRCFRVAQTGDLRADEVRASLHCAALSIGLGAADATRTIANAEQYAAQQGPAPMPDAPRRLPRSAPKGGAPSTPKGRTAPEAPPEAPVAELDSWWRKPGWPAESAPLPRALRSTSDTALGKLLIEAHAPTGGPLVHGAEGLLWRWTGRIWSAIEPTQQLLWVSGLDGLAILGGRNGQTFGVQNQKTKSVCAQAALIAEGMRPLPEGRGGIALADAHLSLDKEGCLVYQTSDPANGARGALDFTASTLKAASVAPPGPWGRFLAETLDPPVSSAFAELVGLGLFGLGALYHRAGLLLGGGANGKSTALDVVAALFPEGVASVPPSQWSDGSSSLTLRQKRLNIVSELPATKGGAASVFKEIVSGDLITRRDLYKAAVSFRPRALHLFSANDAPESEDQSGGYWRRWLVLPFNRVVPKEKRRPGLAMELAAEALPEVAAWALAGASRAVARGALADPPASIDALADMKVRSAPVPLWWSETASRYSPGEFVPGGELHRSFLEWAERSGFKNPLSIIAWGREFRHLDGVIDTRRAGHRGYTVNT